MNGRLSERKTDAHCAAGMVPDPWHDDCLCDQATYEAFIEEDVRE